METKANVEQEQQMLPILIAPGGSGTKEICRALKTLSPHMVQYIYFSSTSEFTRVWAHTREAMHLVSAESPDMQFTVCSVSTKNPYSIAVKRVRL